MLRLTLMALFALLFWQTPVLAEKDITKKGYVIVDLTVLDKDKLKQYGSAAKKLVTEHGGKFIANSKIEVLHGSSTYNVKAIIEFPSRQTASDWYHSAEYQKLIPLRSTAMDAQFHLIQ